MRAREIADVNVIANAGAVRGRIIGAEYFEFWAQSQRRLGGDLDQMRRAFG